MLSPAWDDAAAGEVTALLELQNEFPEFVIWREITGNRTRYVAKRVQPGVSPHTAICATTAELRGVLAERTGQRSPGQAGVAQG